MTWLSWLPDLSIVLSSAEFWGQVAVAVLTAIAAVTTLVMQQRHSDRRYAKERLRERRPLIYTEANLNANLGQDKAVKWVSASPDKTEQERLVGYEIMQLKIIDTTEKLNAFDLPEDENRTTFTFRVRNDSPFAVETHSVGFTYYYRNQLGLCWLPRRRNYRAGETIAVTEQNKNLDSHQVNLYTFQYKWFVDDASAIFEDQMQHLPRDRKKEFLAHSVRAHPFVRLTDGSYHHADYVFRHPPSREESCLPKWLKRFALGVNRTERRIYVKRFKLLGFIPFVYVCV